MSKILLANTEINSIGGIASHLHNTCFELKSRGWEVHCLTTNKRGDNFEEMSKEFTCYDISSYSLSPKKVFTAADLVNSIAPSIILTNNCALMHYTAPLINPKIKAIAVLHSDDSRFYAIAALFPRRFFRWIAPTAGLAARFQPFVDQRLHEKIRVIPHGINRKKFFPKKSRSRGSAFQILFVGFLGESKGANLLPDIFQKIVSGVPDAFLTIIGDGPLRADIDAEFQKRGLQNRVLMNGATSREETAEIMRASHVLLLPTNLEGFGIVIVEAMMCGVVPIASRLAGITDQLVQQGITGLLVTPRDINGFVEAVKKIQINSKLFKAMSSKASKIAAETFSVETMIDRYEALFTEPDDLNGKRKKSIPGWYAEATYQYLHKRLR